MDSRLCCAFRQLAALRSSPVFCRHVLKSIVLRSDAMRRAPVLLLAALSPASAAIVADVSGCAAVDQ